MGTIVTALRLNENMSTGFNSITSAISSSNSAMMAVENSIQRAQMAMDIAASAAEGYDSKLDGIQEALSQVESQLSSARSAQEAFDSAIKSGDPQAYIDAYTDSTRLSEKEISELVKKQEQLNNTYQKTEAALSKANTTYTQQQSKVGQLNQKLTELIGKNNQVQKQGHDMKNPFDKWAIRVTGVYSALRLVRRVMRLINNSLNAVLDATGQWGADDSAVTVMNKFNQSIKATQKSIGETLLPLAAIISDVFIQAFDWIGQKANEAIQWIISNWDLVANVIAVVITVASIMGIAFAIANIQVFLIISAILMLSGVLTDAGITVDQILTGVGATFGWLYGIIYNIVVELYNVFASFGEFFANFLNDPIGSIYRLFYSLADFVLGILQTIGSGIDAIFGTKLASAVAGWRSGLSAAVEAEFGAPAIQFERMQQMDVSHFMETGAEFGAGIGTALTGIGDKLDNFDLSKYTAPGQKAIKTAEQNKLITDEDIKLLADVATMEYQLQYRQITPNVQMEVVVNNQSDWESGFEQFATAIEEMSSSNLVVA